MTLTEFLLARIEEDEAAASLCAEAFPPPWDVSDRGHMVTVRADEPNFSIVTELQQTQVGGGDRWLSEYVAHIARWNPARVLAECEAKRRIVAHADTVTDMAHQIHGEFGVGPITWDDEGVVLLKLLALPYANHPDFQPAWASIDDGSQS